MKSTEKLYYVDSHKAEFDGKVLICEPEKELFKVVLDRTAFFPEGGGQYADNGMLDNAKVVDVQDGKIGDAEVVFHYTDKPLEIDTLVHGVINFEDRFDRMQQHTGEHIVSGIVCKRFGYTNVGFHLGADYCTMDYNGPITKEELKAIEREANKAVFANLKVIDTYPSKEELPNLEYRSKIEIEGQVRLIEIPGYDICACCAPHVSYTGEIGLIKLVNMVNYKGGERVFMLAGERALRDYDAKETSAKQISQMLCVKEEETVLGVTRMMDNEKALKQRIANLKDQLLLAKVQGIEIVSDITAYFDSELEKNEPRELMNLVLNKGAKICAVFAGNDMDGYRYVLGSKTEDVRAIAKELNAKFQGRGGGKPEMVQGSLKGTEVEIHEVLS